MLLCVDPIQYMAKTVENLEEWLVNMLIKPSPSPI